MERAFGPFLWIAFARRFFTYHFASDLLEGKNLAPRLPPLLIGLDKWHCEGEGERVKRRFCMHIHGLPVGAYLYSLLYSRSG